MMMKAATAYNAAANHFDAAPLSFWRRHGVRTVEQLALSDGSRVLDVGCGTGNSAIPAAHAVGPRGHVIGIDIAENMLASARERAQSEGLSNVDFLLRDMTAPGNDLGRFDAVISVFSLFFVQDMAGQLVRLWDLLRPGGQLIVTAWARGALEPGAAVFTEELRRLWPELPSAVRPWDRLIDADRLRRPFQDAGIAGAEILEVEEHQPLAAPEDWWAVALGTGFRWELEQLSPDEQETLRRSTLARLRAMDARTMKTGVLHGLATKR